jgi:5-hydroxyisourate hydrolase
MRDEMALVTSHTLNSSNGTHAGGIAVTLSNLDNGDVLFKEYMDEGGRLSETVDVSGADPKTVYEICFTTEPYWRAQNIPQVGARISDQIVLRFSMPDPDARYHMPLILSPNGYSVWMSVPE